MPQQCTVMASQLQTGILCPVLGVLGVPWLAAAVLLWWCCPWLPWQSWGQCLGPCLCAAVSPGSPEMNSAASVPSYLAFPCIPFVSSESNGKAVGP